MEMETENTFFFNLCFDVENTHNLFEDWLLNVSEISILKVDEFELTHNRSGFKAIYEIGNLTKEEYYRMIKFVITL